MPPGPDREGGFIVLHRRLLSSAVWGLPATQRMVWVELLFATNWRDSEAYVSGRAIVVPRGSALIAGRTLAARAGVSRGVVERAMKAFSALGMVSFTDLGPGARGGTTVRLINVANYRKYQDTSEDDPGQPQDQPRGQPRDNPGAHQNKGTKKQENKEDLPADAGRPVLAVVEQSSPPRLKVLTDSLVAAYAEVRGCPYAHGGARDAQALKRLLPLADDAEILRRWRAGLAASGWASCSTLAQLGSKWNDLAATAAPQDIRVGSAPAQSHDVFRAGGGGVKPWV